MRNVKLFLVLLVNMTFISLQSVACNLASIAPSNFDIKVSGVTPYQHSFVGGIGQMVETDRLSFFIDITPLNGNVTNENYCIVLTSKSGTFYDAAVIGWSKADFITPNSRDTRVLQQFENNKVHGAILVAPTYDVDLVGLRQACEKQQGLAGEWSDVDNSFKESDANNLSQKYVNIKVMKGSELGTAYTATTIIVDSKGVKHNFLRNYGQPLGVNMYSLDGQYIVPDSTFGWVYTSRQRIDTSLVSQISQIISSHSDIR